MENTTSLPSGSSLLKESWSIFKLKRRVLLPITILVVIGAFLLQAGLLQMQGNSSFLIFVTIAGIVLFVLDLFCQVALIRAIDQTTTVKEAFMSTRKKVLGYLFTSILAGLVVLLGFVAFIVPGIIFALWFSMVGYIVVLEGDKYAKALKRSKELVKGFTGQLFMRYIFLGFLALLIYLPGQFIGGDETLLGGLYSALVSLLVTPLAAIYSYLIYKNLRDHKAQAEIPTQVTEVQPVQ